MIFNLVMSDNVTKVVGPYSNFISPPHGTHPVYFSGVIGINQLTGTITAKSFEEEIKTVFENLKLNMEAAHVKIPNIVKVNVYLDDFKYFEEMNKLYSEFLGEHRPCRVTIAAKALPKGALVEIDIIAHI